MNSVRLFCYNYIKVLFLHIAEMLKFSEKKEIFAYSGVRSIIKGKSPTVSEGPITLKERLETLKEKQETVTRPQLIRTLFCQFIAALFHELEVFFQPKKICIIFIYLHK